MQNLTTKLTKSSIFNIKQQPEKFEPLSTLLLQARNGAKLVSIELVPSSKVNLDVLKTVNVNFCSVTWHHNEHMQLEPLQVDTVPPLKFARKLIENGFNVMLHIAGRYMKNNEALNVLEEAKKIGIRSLFVLQGEVVPHFENSGVKYDFLYAEDLVKFVKRKFGDYFSIAVAGYAESKNKTNLQFLKQKVSAGADFIITQALFDFEAYKSFSDECNKAEINVPILPGIWLFPTYDALKSCAYFCKTKVPENVYEAIKSYKNDAEELRKASIAFTKELTSKIFEEDSSPGIHFYTMNNLEFVKEICENMELKVDEI